MEGIEGSLVNITIEDYAPKSEAEGAQKSVSLHHKDENGRLILILNAIHEGITIKQGVLVIKENGFVDPESYMHDDALFKMEDYAEEIKEHYNGKLKTDEKSGYCAIM